MNITFNNTSLMSSPYSVRSFTAESVENREIFVYDLARQRGGHIISGQYKVKRFRMIGSIKGTSKDDLEANIDALKQLFDLYSKNLDIEYAGSTRRYIATAQHLTIERDYFNLTYAPFQVEFIVPDGVGYDTARTENTLATITDKTQEESITIGGTVAPMDFQLTITVTDVSAISAIAFQANGNKITLTTSVSDNDVIVFDQENLKVTKNGTEVAYTGIFPQFFVGVNNFLIEATGTSIEYTRKTSYTKTYA